MIVLADTSVWLDHWRHGNPRFARLLDQGQVVVHPFVLGEIALGDIPRRAEVLARLAQLPPSAVAQHREVLALIERVPLWNRGIGWVDAHLLASALLERTPLWTTDQPLHRAAQALAIAWPD